MLVERHHDEELREKRDVLHKQWEQHDGVNIVFVLCGPRKVNRLLEIIHALLDSRNVFNFGKLIVQAEYFQQVSVGVGVSDFWLCESSSHCPNLWLRHLFVDISPERLNRYFNLSDGQHGVFNSVTLWLVYVDMEVLHVWTVVELGVYPVWVTDCVGVFVEFWVLVGFEVLAFGKDISLTELLPLVTIDNV